MDDRDAMMSALVDHALAAQLVPLACPCDFGPAERYRLEELLAAGPHSFLYRATDRTLSSEGFDATVAVKIFKTAPTNRHEALTVRRVAHPNVLSVMDRGLTDDGMSYLVAEFVDGGDLSQSAVPMAARQAVRLLIKVSRAVQAVHSAGIVHCDLKPSNILLTRAGEPKVADFGLAHWRGDTQEARGNLAFMAPEQFLGLENGSAPPADIYALGGLLYYLVTGKLPLGQTADEIAQAHHHERQAPALGISRDLDRICARPLARARENRYHSAGELADDLERWLRHEPIAWTRPSALRRLSLAVRRRPVISLLAATIVLGAIAAGLTVEYNARKDRQREAAAQAEAVRIAKEKVDATSARVRKQIESYFRMVTGASTGDLQDQYLPGLIWIQWLAESPVIQQDGHVPAAKERLGMLRHLIDTANTSGRGSHLDTLIVKYSFARLALMDDDFMESGRYLDDLERDLCSRLSPEDPVRLSVAAMRVCAEANAAMVQGRDLGGLAARLSEQDAILERNGNAEATRRLIAAVRKKVTAGKGRG